MWIFKFHCFLDYCRKVRKLYYYLCFTAYEWLFTQPRREQKYYHCVQWLNWRLCWVLYEGVILWGLRKICFTLDLFVIIHHSLHRDFFLCAIFYDHNNNNIYIKVSEPFIIVREIDIYESTVEIKSAIASCVFAHVDDFYSHILSLRDIH